MSVPSAQRRTSSVWFIPSLLVICTAVALAVGLLYDGLWDIVASLLLAVPVISFAERWLRRNRAG